MRRGIKNIIIGASGQLIILILGIVVPRFILSNYGDETNGLIGAIGQLFTYLALIEAGVGQSALQALYKPVAENDRPRISCIICATKKMFGKLTIVYCAVVVVFALVYPFLITINDTQTLSFMGSTHFAVFMLIVFQGVSNAVGFYYSATIKQLLTAEGYNYIIVNITTIIRAVTSIFRILLMNLRVNIVVLQGVYLILAVVEALLYRIVIAKKYPWLENNAYPDVQALSQRSAFIIHEVANVIFSSTDMLVLSVFCSLSEVSIYSVYSLVFAALSALINQIHGGCFFILGQAYSQDKERYKRIHDAYDALYIAFVFALITTAYVMILPFIKLYTSDVTSITYVDPWLPLLFSLIQLLSCCRITSSNLIKIAGHARQTIGRAIFESSMNFIVSLILIQFIGIYGVLIGTIVALLYRTNDMILYANHIILNRRATKTYRIVILNLLLFTIMATITRFFSFEFITDYAQLFGMAGFVCMFMFVLYFANSWFSCAEVRQFIWKAVKYRT